MFPKRTCIPLARHSECRNEKRDGFKLRKLLIKTEPYRIACLGDVTRNWYAIVVIVVIILRDKHWFSCNGIVNVSACWTLQYVYNHARISIYFLFFFLKKKAINHRNIFILITALLTFFFMGENVCLFLSCIDLWMDHFVYFELSKCIQDWPTELKIFNSADAIFLPKIVNFSLNKNWKQSWTGVFFTDNYLKFQFF